MRTPITIIGHYRQQCEEIYNQMVKFEIFIN
jgi:hypothetical protein